MICLCAAAAPRSLEITNATFRKGGPMPGAVPTAPAVARVLFDEAHGEAWTIRPEVAAAMQPAHPQDSSFALAARVLIDRSLSVAAHVDGALDAACLRDADVLVLAHPSEPRWERTVGGS